MEDITNLVKILCFDADHTVEEAQASKTTHRKYADSIIECLSQSKVEGIPFSVVKQAMEKGFWAYTDWCKAGEEKLTFFGNGTSIFYSASTNSWGFKNKEEKLLWVSIGDYGKKWWLKEEDALKIE